jgi:hypothetical protein
MVFDNDLQFVLFFRRIGGFILCVVEILFLLSGLGYVTSIVNDLNSLYMLWFVLGSCPVIRGNKWSCTKWMRVEEFHD